MPSKESKEKSSSKEKESKEKSSSKEKTSSSSKDKSSKDKEKEKEKGKSASKDVDAADTSKPSADDAAGTASSSSEVPTRAGLEPADACESCGKSVAAVYCQVSCRCVGFAVAAPMSRGRAAVFGLC